MNIKIALYTSVLLIGLCAITAAAQVVTPIVGQPKRVYGEGAHDSAPTTVPAIGANGVSASFDITKHTDPTSCVIFALRIGDANIAASKICGGTKDKAGNPATAAGFKVSRFVPFDGQQIKTGIVIESGKSLETSSTMSPFKED